MMARKYADQEQTVYLVFAGVALLIAGVVLIFVGGNRTTPVQDALSDVQIQTPNMAMIVGGGAAALVGALTLVLLVLFSMWRAERWNLAEKTASSGA